MPLQTNCVPAGVLFATPYSKAEAGIMEVPQHDVLCHALAPVRAAVLSAAPRSKVKAKTLSAPNSALQISAYPCPRSGVERG